MEEKMVGFIKTVDLTAEEARALIRLDSSKDFETLEKVMERMLQSQAFALISSDDIETELETRERNFVRGGYLFLKGIKDIIERARQKI